MSSRPSTSDHSLADMKADVWRLLQAVPGSDAAAALQRHLHADAVWHLPHPFEALRGPDAVMHHFVAPLQAAFPDLERRTDIYMGGPWQSPPAGATGYSPPEVAAPGLWVSTTGHYVGTFKRSWLGIEATGEPATLRFGEFYRWQRGEDGNDRVVEARILLDIVDLARQAGLRLLPLSLGREWRVPGPAGHDGVLLDATDSAHGAASMAQVLAMVAGLFSFDGRNLQTMGMERFWHPQMMWYGPCGIGSTRGIGGFQRHHQAPFLHAFPDRKGAGHRARIAEGAYVASTGWPSVRATHAGDYLGAPATGRPIGMRVMDWWRCEGPWLKENWVLIDLPHLLLQMDVDILAPLR